MKSIIIVYTPSICGSEKFLGIHAATLFDFQSGIGNKGKKFKTLCADKPQSNIIVTDFNLITKHGLFGSSLKQYCKL